MIVIALVLDPLAAWASPSWTVASGSGSGTLKGISCPTTSFCVAVGFRSDPYMTYIDSWNGRSWKVSSNSRVGTLEGVACVSAKFCEAVGHYPSASEVERTLIETWNGSTWKVATSPSLGTDSNYLYGVSCASAAACESVGSYANDTLGWQTLAESWNGHKWTVVPSASPGLGTGSNELRAVSCTSARSCQAVGDYFKSGDTYQALVEHWNGSSWQWTSDVPNPNSGRDIDYLYGVSCVAATSCKAVGFYDNATAATLIETWNGSVWKVATSPDRATDDYLNAVSCASTNSCKAVGYATDSTGVKTLIVTWNGTTWSLSASPNKGADSYLNAVKCATPTSCKAAGYYNLSSRLIESY